MKTVCELELPKHPWIGLRRKELEQVRIIRQI